MNADKHGFLKLVVWESFFMKVYPVVLLALVYVTWLIARGHLGHQPRPYQDDPLFIGASIGFIYGVGFVLCLILPFVFGGVLWRSAKLARQGTYTNHTGKWRKIGQKGKRKCVEDVQSK